MYKIKKNKMEIFRYKTGQIVKNGDKITGLYKTGNADGIIIVDCNGILSVRDSDNDILDIKNVLLNPNVRLVHPSI